VPLAGTKLEAVSYVWGKSKKKKEKKKKKTIICDGRDINITKSLPTCCDAFNFLTDDVSCELTASASIKMTYKSRAIKLPSWGKYIA
jgi:hypothetical protein